MTNKEKGAANALQLLDLIEKLSRFSVINCITDGFRRQSIYCLGAVFKPGDTALFDSGRDGLKLDLAQHVRPAKSFRLQRLTAVAYVEVIR